MFTGIILFVSQYISVYCVVFVHFAFRKDDYLSISDAYTDKKVSFVQTCNIFDRLCAFKIDNGDDCGMQPAKITLFSARAEVEVFGSFFLKLYRIKRGCEKDPLWKELTFAKIYGDQLRSSLKKPSLYSN